MPILRQRFPETVAGWVEELDSGQSQRACFRALFEARDILEADGFRAPSFHDIVAGVRPQGPGDAEPGEWDHGWQFYTSDARERTFRRSVVLPEADAAARSMLRSQSGKGAAAAFLAVPWDTARQVPPERFRAMLCRRLRHPILLAARKCEGCGCVLDAYGDHYAACMRTGRVQVRARPVERAWLRVLREAGATTHFQKLLRETTLPTDPLDGRRIDILATGLTVMHGRPLFCDATVRSPLRADGCPHGRAADEDGFVLHRALVDKLSAYGDVAGCQSAELLVLAVEVGGRWNDTAITLVDVLAWAKVSDSPPLLRRSAHAAWAARWWSMLGVSVQSALAASILAPVAGTLCFDEQAVELPPSDDLLDGQRWAS